MPKKPKTHMRAHRARARNKHRESVRDDRGFTASRRWRRLREIILRNEPVCRICAEHRVYVPATEVDHIISRRERPDLTWDLANLQPLCSACHARKTREENRHGG